MNINRNNYEAWLLDLIEGSLSPDQVLQVRDFLLLNPDCAEGLNEFDPWILEADPISFSRKETLRKAFPDHKSRASEIDFDLLCIAMMEGDLSEIQKQEYLQMLVGDDEKMKEWLLWKQMKLTREAIFFDRKGALKRRARPRTRLIWISIATAAAAVVLFFSLFRIDPQIKPAGQLGLEVDPIIESPNSEAEFHAVTRSIPVKESSLENILHTGEAAKLAFRKHQDPPEGIDQEDTTGDELSLKEAVLRGRPLNVALLEQNLMKPSIQASYDRIEAHDLPSPSAYSGSLEEDQYSEDGLGLAAREFVERKNISLLSIASAGVEGINRLAGSDLSLNISRDEKGEVSGFRFRSGLLSVDSPVKKQNIPR